MHGLMMKNNTKNNNFSERSGLRLKKIFFPLILFFLTLIISQPAFADNLSNCGKGIELDGINDWINIPDLTLRNDFTIEGWFKLAPGFDYRDPLFGQEGSGPDIHFSAGRVRLYAYGIRVTANTPLIANTWGAYSHHSIRVKLIGIYKWRKGCNRKMERNPQHKSHRSR